MDTMLKTLFAAALAMGFAFAAPAAAQQQDERVSVSPLDDNWAEPDWSEGADGRMRPGPGLFTDRGAWYLLGDEDTADRVPEEENQDGPVKVERRRR